MSSVRRQFTSSSLPPYLDFLPQCRVLLCQIHGRCFTLLEIDQHLESEHNSSRVIRERVAKAANSLDLALNRKDAPLPAAGADPINGLEVMRGHQCTYGDSCYFITCNIKKFRGIHSHLQSHHKIPWGDQNINGSYKEVHIQSLFHLSHPAYFIVRLPGETSISRVGKKGLGDERSANQALKFIDLEEAEEGGQVIDAEVSAQGVSLTRSQQLGRTSRYVLRKPLDSKARPAPSPPPSRSAIPRITESSCSKSVINCDSSFAQMVFYTERKDTEKVHLCLASDLMSTAESARSSFGPLDVDFDIYRSILNAEKVMRHGLQLVFVDAGGRKVQVTNQMTFRAALICQLAQKVEMITFSSEPITKPPILSVIPTSSESTAVSNFSGQLFAHTVFRTERQDAEKIHICLASDLRAADLEDTVNMGPVHVDYDIYCELLREEEVLKDDLDLGFIDNGGKRILITNQMMFRAAVVYQVTQKADMITFSSEPINRPTRFSSTKSPSSSQNDCSSIFQRLSEASFKTSVADEPPTGSTEQRAELKLPRSYSPRASSLFPNPPKPATRPPMPAALARCQEGSAYRSGCRRVRRRRGSNSSSSEDMVKLFLDSPSSSKEITKPAKCSGSAEKIKKRKEIPVGMRGLLLESQKLSKVEGELPEDSPNPSPTTTNGRKRRREDSVESAERSD